MLLTSIRSTYAFNFDPDNISQWINNIATGYDDDLTREQKNTSMLSMLLGELYLSDDTEFLFITHKTSELQYELFKACGSDLRPSHESLCECLFFGQENVVKRIYFLSPTELAKIADLPDNFGTVYTTLPEDTFNRYYRQLSLMIMPKLKNAADWVAI